MCTVTYLPLPSGGYLLTSNRDEQTGRRSALPPQVYPGESGALLYPLDPLGQGTWIASSASGCTLCLLNGAFRPHHPQPPYRMSRGRVLLDFFGFSSPEVFVAQYDLRGIEPFTLVIVASHPRRYVGVLRWDGHRVALERLTPEKPRIWSSVTLYGPAVTAERERWFAEWLAKQSAFRLEAIRRFHRTAGTGDAAQDLWMNRHNQVQTVSITSVWLEPGYLPRMFYTDAQAEDALVAASFPALVE